MSAFIYVVSIPDGSDQQVDLFERREDAEEYAGLFAGAIVDDLLLLDEGLAASTIEEARADIEAEGGLG